MEITRTVRVKLEASPDVFLPTVLAYTKAYNFVCQSAWDAGKITDGVLLHHMTYKAVREWSFGPAKHLPADLAISARVKATESIRSVKKLQKKEDKRAKKKGVQPRIFRCPRSKQMSIRYSYKTFNIWFDRNLVSLQVIGGRVKIPIHIHEYYKEYITWKRCSAELIIRRSKVFLNIVFSKFVNDPIPNGKAVGIDRGLKRIAVTSRKQFYGGGRVKHISNRYQRLRSVLQHKGHSGKRHFVKISCKENRFRRDVNHCVSKQIVSQLEPGTTIVFEDLTDINSNTKKKFRKKDTVNRQKQKDRMSWSFKQLEEFISYKAFDKRCRVVFVQAKNTSLRCSKCGHIAVENRVCQTIFKCVNCGYQCNADLNASFNILQKHLDVTCHPDEAAANQPNVPQTAMSGLSKPTNSFVGS